jgi:hypothetical protein
VDANAAQRAAHVTADETKKFFIRNLTLKSTPIKKYLLYNKKELPFREFSLTSCQRFEA